MNKILEILLEPGEYYKEVVEKDTIYIHHTAGGHRPDWVIQGAWENDKTKTGLKLPVATSFVIGGISTTDNDASWDGVIVKAFDDQYWAHHLGTQEPNNKSLNSKSIAIEICNYGQLTMGKDGKFYNYVNKPVPKEMVTELKVPFRGFTYFHSYTEKQLAALRDLLLDIKKRHPKVELNKGLIQFINVPNTFELNSAALKGFPGIWSHTNVRKDKLDCYPHPQLLELLKSLQ